MGRLLTDEQQLIMQTVRQFAVEEIRPRAMEVDLGNTFPFDLNKRCGELGFIGADVPEEFGGAGLDINSSLLILEEISKECPALGCSMMVSMTLPLFLCCSANPEHKQYIKPLISGEKVGAIAQTDPAGVLNMAEWPILAVREGDEFVLNGTKLFVTNSHAADYYMVSGLCEGKPCDFFVKKDSPGFGSGHIERKMGMNGASNGTITLHNVRIPVSDQLIVSSYLPNLAAGYLHMSAVALGTMEGAYEKTREYLNIRTNKMRPIIEMQVAAHKLARIKTKIEVCRSFINDVSTLIEANRPDNTLIRMVKAFVTEPAVDCTRECVQLYGGLGYCEDTGIAHYMRDAMGTTVGDLTSDIQYDLIAKKLAKQDKK